MVGRFVQQQDIGLTYQGTSQQDAAFESSGEALKQLIRWQPHLLHQILHADIGLPILLGAADAESGMDHFKNRPFDSIRHFLRQAGQHDAVRFGDFTFLRFLLTGDDAHDAGLARAIASHEADALARIDLKIDLIQQGAVGVAQGDAAKLEKGHGEK